MGRRSRREPLFDLFDSSTLSELFNLGLVEIRARDRRLVLTESGQSTYQALSAAARSPESRP